MEESRTHLFFVPCESVKPGRTRGWYIWDAKNQREIGPFSFDDALINLGNVLPITEEKILSWHRSLEGLSRYADDAQDTKAADKYFTCKKLLEILREVSAILSEQLD